MNIKFKDGVMSMMSPTDFNLCSNNLHVNQNQSRLLSVKGAYWISLNREFFQYCDSNIVFFSIAPPLVIALPTLR